MPEKKGVIFRHYSDVMPVSTSHGVGEKRVLASQTDIGMPITQIARTILHQGEQVARHTHLTMDEHFLFLKGSCVVTIGEETISCSDNDYLFVPAGMPHLLKILSNTELITIGVAYDK